MSHIKSYTLEMSSFSNTMSAKFSTSVSPNLICQDVAIHTKWFNSYKLYPFDNGQEGMKSGVISQTV